MARRPATLEEARALAHPLRMRILRLCLDEELTNKQIADRLDKDPATVIHHVRTLVSAGFLVAGAVRAGASGALEKPYRATGKSWTLDVSELDEDLGVGVAMVDAFRDELAESGAQSVETLSRFAVTLTKPSLEELVSRLQDIVEEYGNRPPEKGGEPYGVLVGLHRRAWPAQEGDRET
ncbi:MAG: helix-turn-helix domain-containing protein [Actinomycetota bacterium]|nr:helix-turn-helix domain-containing protein [Actinomycetota bacterium]